MATYIPNTEQWAELVSKIKAVQPADEIGVSTTTPISQRAATQMLFPTTNEDGEVSTTTLATQTNSLAPTNATISIGLRNKVSLADGVEKGSIAISNGYKNDITLSNGSAQPFVSGLVNTVNASNEGLSIVHGALNSVNPKENSAIVYGMSNDLGTDDSTTNPYAKVTVLAGNALKNKIPGTVAFGSRGNFNADTGTAVSVAYLFNDYGLGGKSADRTKGEYIWGNTALGTNVETTGFNNVVIGYSATAQAKSRTEGVKFSVALGAGSRATRDYTVSVGGKVSGALIIKRTVSNVAPGVEDDDAVTVGQLKDYVATNAPEPENFTDDEWSAMWA